MSVQSPSNRLSICLAFLGLFAINSAPPAVAQSKEGNVPKPVVVVELFTSQGCSSCPPADQVLQQIEQVARKGDLPVYTLSFHVDYWNRLGWKDPYSDEAFSIRQRSYASAAKSRRVYTPQMIVNGTTEFVGSDRSKAHSAISQSLRPVTKRQSAPPRIKLNAELFGTETDVQVMYSVSGHSPGDVLNLALVVSPDPNRVPRGENAGRELSHVNVVVNFRTIPIDEVSGKVRMRLPKGVSANETSLVAYVQKATSTLAITSASKVGISPSTEDG